MTPFYTDDWLTVYGGDCIDVLRDIAADSVDCVVTSPPYWGLRDYGTAGQIGLERTPEEYVANLVAVFAEVRRVLKPSGCLFLNLGDSYASTTSGTGTRGGSFAAERSQWQGAASSRDIPLGLKSKDLIGIPWRVAFALQADGWYLRSDIIWSKPNPMPESVTDRPTKAHEYLFLLTKSARYFFDADAVREAALQPPGEERASGNRTPKAEAQGGARTGTGSTSILGSNQGVSTRNIRSVWTIATRPYPGAHFAVFPPELPERCIKAGSSERGVCPECGKPWERVVERETVPQRTGDWKATGEKHRNDIERKGGFYPVSIDKGWVRTCAHNAEPVPATILDPFAGSGTVGMVANRLSRRAILIDLNPEYLKQQMRRNAQTPLGLEVSVVG